MKTVKIFIFVVSAVFVAGFFAPGVLAGVQYNIYPQPTCTYHAYRDCVGNSLYWFNSCGGQQDFIQTCAGANLICKYGQCIKKPEVYIKNYTVKCYNNNLYWHDSKGYAQTLYKNCNDNNECTQDSCSGSKCQNTPIKDCPAEQPEQPAEVNLGVSFFAKKDINAVSLDKAVSMAPNGNIYFLAVVRNDSTAAVNNINISANIPSEVSMLGNLKIDGNPVQGDIISGITIASMPVGSSKTITFEGKTQTFTASGDKQATISANAQDQSKSDSLTITLNPEQPAGVSSAPADSALVNFLKRWYLWILAAIVLVFLFVVIFRRLSSNNA